MSRLVAHLAEQHIARAARNVGGLAIDRFGDVAREVVVGVSRDIAHRVGDARGSAPRIVVAGGGGVFSRSGGDADALAALERAVVAELRCHRVGIAHAAFDDGGAEAEGVVLEVTDGIVALAAADGGHAATRDLATGIERVVAHLEVRQTKAVRTDHADGAVYGLLLRGLLDQTTARVIDTEAGVGGVCADECAGGIAVLHITTNGQATQVVELRGNNPSGRGAQRWRGDGRCLIAGVVADEGGEAAWIGDTGNAGGKVPMNDMGELQSAAVFLAVADHAGAELRDGIILADIAIVGVRAVQRGDAGDLAERIVGANLATANGCAGGEAVAVRVIGPGEGLAVGGGEEGSKIRTRHLASDDPA